MLGEGRSRFVSDPRICQSLLEFVVVVFTATVVAAKTLDEVALVFDSRFENFEFRYDFGSVFGD
jgi:hypothetical protein